VVRVTTESLIPCSAGELARGLARPSTWQFTCTKLEPLKTIAFASGTTAGDEADIHRLAVLPKERRQGAALFLLTQVIRHLEEKGVRRFFLELRAENQGALNLYKRVGFSKIGIREGYYRSPKDDAILMRRKAP